MNNKKVNIDDIVGIDKDLFVNGMINWREEVFNTMKKIPVLSMAHLHILESMMSEYDVRLFYNIAELKNEMSENNKMREQKSRISYFIRDNHEKKFHGSKMHALYLLNFDYGHVLSKKEMKEGIKILWDSLCKIDKKYHFLKSYFIFIGNKESLFERKDYLMYLNESFDEIEKNLNYFNFFNVCNNKQRNNTYKTRISGILTNFITFPLPPIKVSKNLPEDFQLITSFYDRLKTKVMNERKARIEYEYGHSKKSKEEKDLALERLFGVFERTLDVLTEDFAGLSGLKEKIAKKDMLDDYSDILDKLSKYVVEKNNDFPSYATSYSDNDIAMYNVKREEKKLILLIEVPNHLSNKFTTEFLFQNKKYDFEECSINFHRINTNSLKIEVSKKMNINALLNKKEEILELIANKIEVLLTDFKQQNKNASRSSKYNFGNSKDYKEAQEKQEDFFTSTAQNIRTLLLYDEMEKINKVEVVNKRKKI